MTKEKIKNKPKGKKAPLKSSRGPGQPSKLSPEVTEKILVAIAKGATLHLACDYAGIDYSTLCKWRIACENGDSRYFELFHRIKEVEGKAALVWLDKIDRAMNDGAWQAAAWKLERRHHKFYSQNAQLLALAEEVAELKRLHGVKRDEEKPNEESDQRF